MVKFVILFQKPVEVGRFEDAYNDFLALVEQMPSIKQRQVNTVLGSPVGETTLYRVLEIYFDDQDAMTAALKSFPGQRAGGSLASRFATGTVEMYFADVYEEAGAQTEVTDGSA